MPGKLGGLLPMTAPSAGQTTEVFQQNAKKSECASYIVATMRKVTAQAGREIFVVDFRGGQSSRPAARLGGGERRQRPWSVKFAANSAFVLSNHFCLWNV